MKNGRQCGLAIVAAAALSSACNDRQTTLPTAALRPLAQATIAAAHAPFPASVAAFGDGYLVAGRACRRLGESGMTNDWLDASADLVGGPSTAKARRLRGRIVGTIEGITIVSVAHAQENAGMAAATRKAFGSDAAEQGGT